MDGEELDAPALVGGILRQHGLADGICDRVLQPCVDAHLAPEHADRIGALAERAIVPALDGKAAAKTILKARILLKADQWEAGATAEHIVMPVELVVRASAMAITPPARKPARATAKR